MKTTRNLVLLRVVFGAFASGCVSGPVTEEVPVAETEQSLGVTTQAQEREVTYYAEAEKINIVGFCSGPFRCFGPKGLVCSGIKTAFYDIEWFSCN